MKRLHRSAIGALVAASLVWAVIPTAAADGLDAEPAGDAGIESPAAPGPTPAPEDGVVSATPAAPEPGTEPSDGAATESPTPSIDLTLNGWKKEGGAWHYYDRGVKRTGWLSDGGSWFYGWNSDRSQCERWTNSIAKGRAPEVTGSSPAARRSPYFLSSRDAEPASTLTSIAPTGRKGQ